MFFATTITGYEYDGYGRVIQITYPENFSVKNVFNQFGYLSEVRRGDNNALIWKAGTRNELGLWNNYTLGNNLLQSQFTFDPNYYYSKTIKTQKLSDGTYLQDLEYSFNNSTGNLTWRKDHMHKNGSVSFIEEFGYDDLNRLAWTKINSGTQKNVGYDNAKAGNISNKELVGTYSYTSVKPHAVTSVSAGITGGDQTITYTNFKKINTISQNSNEHFMSFTYGPDEGRRKSVYKLNGTTLTTRYYYGNHEKEINSGLIRHLYYVNGGDGLAAIMVIDNSGNKTLYYVLNDYLGSFNLIADESGNAVNYNGVKQEYSFDPWGRRRNANDWTYNAVPSVFLFTRGFTGHEHMDAFSLINMNGRVYDPVLGVFLSPDNFVQAPDFTQNFNRYAYCFNNPLIYTDPSGEFFWAAIPIATKIAIAVGAAIGTYSGYKIADAKGYDMGNWQTYGYMLGGGIIGGLSGYAGATIAAGGGFMANTAGIAYSSLFNSMGMSALSGGMIQPSVSFGVASYDFGTGEWGYLGKKGNSALANIGYGFGALANLSDVVSLFSGGGQNIDVNSATTKDGHEWWGHSSMTDENGNTLVSVGPDSQVQKAASLSETWKNSIKGANVDWDTYLGAKGTWTVKLNNVSTTAINKYATGMTRWDLLLNSCVGHTTRALWRAGVPTLYAFHPHMLNLQLLARQLGIYSSPYLYQIPK